MFKSPIAKANWLVIAVLLLYWAGCGSLLPLLPDNVPSHWNMHGVIDAYTTKTNAAVVLPALPLFVYLLLVLLPNFDPRRADYRDFSSSYHAIILALTGFIAVVSFLPLATALGYPLPVPTVLNVMLPLLMIVLGCNMPKIRPNHFIGIRTPWALRDEENWRKTHGFAGKAMVYGALFALTGLPFSPLVSLVIVMSGTFIPMTAAAWYSYYLSKKKPDKPKI